MIACVCVLVCLLLFIVVSANIDISAVGCLNDGHCLSGCLPLYIFIFFLLFAYGEINTTIIRPVHSMWEVSYIQVSIRKHAK